MRGNPPDLRQSGPHFGSIPAHAGEPPAPDSGARRPRVYPRACGGTVLGDRRDHADAGLSPRMRGNPVSVSGRHYKNGSIPAHAGEPTEHLRRGADSRVYPRACGGTSDAAHHMNEKQGLSPRMRGNRDQALPLTNSPGSIPAHAGEPAGCCPRTSRCRVYPRACGGTIRLDFGQHHGWGLSPRMRGNRKPGIRRDVESGSIPAHAGEPLVANLLILLVFKEQGDEGHPLTSLQEQNAVRNRQSLSAARRGFRFAGVLTRSHLARPLRLPHDRGTTTRTRRRPIHVGAHQRTDPARHKRPAQFPA